MALMAVTLFGDCAMTFLASRSGAHSRLRAGLATLTLAVAACSTAEKTPDTTAMTSNPAAMPAADSASAASASGNMGGMGNMENMTGDADRDFLRMMSDHHKGLIAMAHMTKDRKEGGRAVADAKKLDAAQDDEIDKMQTMLEKDFKDPYAPKVTADHQAMIDELKGKTGTDYDRSFYQNVIKHHEQALKMVNAYLPTSKNAMVKQMAEKMKSDQSKEIADFQMKVAKIQ